jgi:hypothetical protein
LGVICPEKGRFLFFFCFDIVRYWRRDARMGYANAALIPVMIDAPHGEEGRPSGSIVQKVYKEKEWGKKGGASAAGRLARDT